MNTKQLLKLTANEDAIYYLMEMVQIQQNMCSKTVYEQRTAKIELKDLAAKILEELK